ncbi:hypothetical protein POM88_038632 [Heracleum sosnowskyi]|uniref:PPM-type phosphatase domain-containing protein n=1 Tax=Heracleum sosnowskyi TaxID=360622 RepID=A0AAD8HAR2_9APIA|nr:hypothetical protein POM88_038632 [Heracleum sosnowskyi]
MTWLIRDVDHGGGCFGTEVPDYGDRWTVTVASVGDSRCILDTEGGPVSELTVDHRLEDNKRTCNNKSCRGLPAELAARQVVKEISRTRGLKDDTTCIVVDVIPPDNSAPPSPPPKKQNRFRALLFRKRSHDSASKLSRKLSAVGIVEELFEEGSAMLAESEVSDHDNVSFHENNSNIDSTYEDVRSHKAKMVDVPIENLNWNTEKSQSQQAGPSNDGNVPSDAHVTSEALVSNDAPVTSEAPVSNDAPVTSEAHVSNYAPTQGNSTPRPRKKNKKNQSFPAENPSVYDRETRSASVGGIIKRNGREAITIIRNDDPEYPMAMLVDMIRMLLEETWTSMDIQPTHADANGGANVMAGYYIGHEGGIREMDEPLEAISHLI